MIHKINRVEYFSKNYSSHELDRIAHGWVQFIFPLRRIGGLYCLILESWLIFGEKGIKVVKVTKKKARSSLDCERKWNVFVCMLYCLIANLTGDHMVQLLCDNGGRKQCCFSLNKIERIVAGRTKADWLIRSWQCFENVFYNSDDIPLGKDLTMEPSVGKRGKKIGPWIAA